MSICQIKLKENWFNPGVNAMPLTRNRVKRRVRLSIGNVFSGANFYDVNIRMGNAALIDIT
jgi:hypothetical protein